MQQLQLSINSKKYHIEVDQDMPLLWVLRDILGLTGTKYGCGISQCGACTVLCNNNPVRSCSIPVALIKDQEILTIEGVEKTKFRALQESWIDQQVPQCGYCQSGQILSAIGLLTNNPKPSIQEIVTAMTGNICRCGTYPRILKAIQEVVNSNKIKDGK